MKNDKGQVIRIKKCTTPTLEAKQIYKALGYEEMPYYMKKSVVPEN
jgi:hypothetical protein